MLFTLLPSLGELEGEVDDTLSFCSDGLEVPVVVVVVVVVAVDTSAASVLALLLLAVGTGVVAEADVLLGSFLDWNLLSFDFKIDSTSFRVSSSISSMSQS
jgi:hypothetical protein